MSKATKSEGTVAAEDQLAAREEGSTVDNLEQQAKEQKKLRDEQLAAGAKAKSGQEQDHLDNKNVAAARVSSSGTVNGFMDNTSRMYGNDALENHFCTMDMSDSGVKDGLKAAGLEGHQGNYGVYLGAGSVDEKSGRPVLAVVRLRDETNAQVTVPYEALTASAARGR